VEWEKPLGKNFSQGVFPITKERKKKFQCNIKTTSKNQNPIPVISGMGKTLGKIFSQGFFPQLRKGRTIKTP